MPTSVFHAIQGEIQPTLTNDNTCNMHGNQDTHYTIGSQVSLTPPKQQQWTWAEHLHQLPTSKQWAFSHLILLDQGLPLAIAIQLGKARVVSNGSLKNRFGMAVWVYYHEETNELLGSSRLVMLGYLEDQSSYRSELSGIYGIAATIVGGIIP